MSNTEVIKVHPLVEAGLASLEKSRWFLNAMLEGLSEDQLMVRPCGSANHAMWCAGHIAVTEDMFLVAMSGEPSNLPDQWNALFAYQTTPSDDAALYPSREALEAGLVGCREALVLYLSALSEEDLSKAMPDGLSTLAPTYAHVANALAFHEGVHSGQISVCRRMDGFAPLF